jgi:peptidoglycan-N-acetylmuramic acid deacetylase
MKKWIVSITALALVCALAFPVSAASLGWYCKRNKEHKQPTLDPKMTVIEKYDAYYVDKNHGDADEDKVIYLTFDAGYENGNVEKILNVLKEESVPAAFFILGNLIRRNKSLVERMQSEGHLVCNHTMHHHNMTKVSSAREFERELASLETLYRETFGSDMAKYYRPPEGTFNEETMKYAQDLGYKTIFWSIAYADWDNDRQPSTKHAMEKILDNLHNGAVILLHPTSATNASIMKDLISEIKKEGYRFGTLHELTQKTR